MSHPAIPVDSCCCYLPDLSFSLFLSDVFLSFFFFAPPFSTGSSCSCLSKRTVANDQLAGLLVQTCSPLCVCVYNINSHIDTQRARGSLRGGDGGQHLSETYTPVSHTPPVKETHTHSGAHKQLCVCLCGAYIYSKNSSF